ncbi:hypothetical protein IFM89_025902 [Coptis chinensis]|uniref:RNase H type-1 domain-containing protein n=1 Tax=Coptis chinensis TaxID=261450 RepID=A0A835HXD9_9MAGN|nr:hypothetical protein IFM89_025902 [Coptis chinensis]
MNTWKIDSERRKAQAMAKSERFQADREQRRNKSAIEQSVRRAQVVKARRARVGRAQMIPKEAEAVNLEADLQMVIYNEDTVNGQQVEHDTRNEVENSEIIIARPLAQIEPSVRFLEGSPISRNREQQGFNGATVTALETAFSEEDPISTMPLHVNVIKDVAWINPPPGWVKINFDAAFVNTGTYATLAVVGRDHERRILGGCSKKMKATTSAEAELLAAELAVDFALLQQWKDIIFEGDAMEVVEACKHGANSAPLRWRTMLLNMFCNLNSLHSFSFRHTPRACNLLAHKLVAWATKRGPVELLIFERMRIVAEGDLILEFPLNLDSGPSLVLSSKLLPSVSFDHLKRNARGLRIFMFRIYFGVCTSSYATMRGFSPITTPMKQVVYNCGHVGRKMSSHTYDVVSRLPSKSHRFSIRTREFQLRNVALTISRRSFNISATGYQVFQQCFSKQRSNSSYMMKNIVCPIRHRARHLGSSLPCQSTRLRLSSPNKDMVSRVRWNTASWLQGSASLGLFLGLSICFSSSKPAFCEANSGKTSDNCDHDSSSVGSVHGKKVHTNYSITSEQ